ncbi:MAG: hypothetical protein JWN83_1283 [Chitinophagaceae bacterium]|nr:hypothetical protein [Chitinophagaceae bacterium]
MLTKFFYITCIFFLSKSNAFAQVAYATASATIVTPVGAEVTGDINFDDLSMVSSRNRIAGNDSTRKLTGGVNLAKDATAGISLNIIGGSFAYDITLQTDPVILKRQTGNETMRVNVFRGLPVTGQNNDIINLPLHTSIAAQAFQAPGIYTSSFNITVNFN